MKTRALYPSESENPFRNDIEVIAVNEEDKIPVVLRVHRLPGSAEGLYRDKQHVKIYTPAEAHKKFEFVSELNREEDPDRILQLNARYGWDYEWCSYIIKEQKHFLRFKLKDYLKDFTEEQKDFLLNPQIKDNIGAGGGLTVTLVDYVLHRDNDSTLQIRDRFSWEFPENRPIAKEFPGERINIYKELLGINQDPKNVGDCEYQFPFKDGSKLVAEILAVRDNP